MSHPAPTLMAIALAVACGGSDSLSPTEPIPGTTAVLEVGVALAPEVPTFKVDGRLQATFELGAPFAGASEVGVVTLPAGQRQASGSVVVPRQTGVLRLREITFTPAAPFLCGTGPVIDPRFEQAVAIRLALCQP